MTKEEAIQAMKEGKKLTHRYFTSKEWVTMKEDGSYLFEDGVSCSALEFWTLRGQEGFNIDWEIFQD